MSVQAAPPGGIGPIRVVNILMGREKQKICKDSF